MLPAQPNQSLIDGLACLQALAGSGRPVGSRELARELGLEPTRANRLLKTLAHLGMARQTPGRRYLPGPAMHVLSVQSMFGSGLLRRALGPLEALHATGLIVALGVLWRDAVAYLYHAEPGMAASAALGRVGLFPATRSAIGLALLAAQDDARVRAQYAGRTVDGFATLSALHSELRLTRERGYARVLHQARPVDASIAVTLGQPAYAAVALAGHITADAEAALVAQLRAAAGRIDALALPDDTNLASHEGSES